VIKTFKSKDIKGYWETSKPRGINPNFARKVARVLTLLNAAQNIEALQVPGFGLHQLTGNRQGQWAITVSHNWRITFYFEDGNAFEVNFEDYHGS